MGTCSRRSFPDDRHLVTAILGVAAVGLLVAYLSRHLPRSAAAVARTAAVVIFIVTVLAPATRFGYLIYPANMFVWSYFLAPIEAEASVRGSVRVVRFDDPHLDRRGPGRANRRRRVPG